MNAMKWIAVWTAVALTVIATTLCKRTDSPTSQPTSKSPSTQPGPNKIEETLLGPIDAMQPSRVFSGDGRHFAYLASRGQKTFVVEDGQAGAEYDEILNGSLIFSPDGKRLAYAARKGEKFLAILDGKEQKYYDRIIATHNMELRLSSPFSAEVAGITTNCMLFSSDTHTRVTWPKRTTNSFWFVTAKKVNLTMRSVQLSLAPQVDTLCSKPTSVQSVSSSWMERK